LVLIRCGLQADQRSGRSSGRSRVNGEGERLGLWRQRNAFRQKVAEGRPGEAFAGAPLERSGCSPTALAWTSR